MRHQFEGDDEEEEEGDNQENEVDPDLADEVDSEPEHPERVERNRLSDGEDAADDDDLDSSASEANSEELDLCQNLDEEDAQLEGTGGTPAQSLDGRQDRLARRKQYHLSAEGQKLEKLQEEHGFPYTLLPAVIHSGIYRHPSNSFWSSRYPGCAWTTSRWKDEASEAFGCMIKMMRHLIREHLRTSAATRTHTQNKKNKCFVSRRYIVEGFSRFVFKVANQVP